MRLQRLAAMAAAGHAGAMAIPLWRRLLPGTCLLCELPVPDSAEADLCEHCATALPWNEPACPRCAVPLPAGLEVGSHCRQCESRPPPFVRALAPLRFEGFPAHWVRSLKDHLGVVEGRVLATLLARAATRLYLDHTTGRRPDLLLPVPLTWRRLVRRGHNQALTLAVPVARALGAPLWRLATTRRAGPSQRGRGRAGRLDVSAASFRSRHRFAEPGPCIAIVDDVLTTGATAAALAKTLLDAGAAEVHVLAATRTPPPR